jgi:hypothetical protein
MWSGALDDAGLRVRHLELRQPSLQEVLLSKTGRELDTDAHTGYAAESVAAS